jgi:colicin import membrane protein
MPRKLKTYQTSLGFYDLAIAAPSMKAALEAWGADSNLFHQGVATESEDSDVIAATMAAPGVVLKRPVGSSASFKEHAELPTGLLGDGTKGKHGKNSSSSRKLPPPKINEKAARKAAAQFEREEATREARRQREEAALAKERERREKAIAKVQTALDQARKEHDAKADAIEAQRAALDQRAQDEETRWGKLRAKLEAALRRARE